MDASESLAMEPGSESLAEWREMRRSIRESERDYVESLPSSSTTSTDGLCSEPDSDAQAEWERSLEQLQLILTMMIVPWFGKYFGRKFAYWSWTRYMEWAHNADVRFTNKTAFKVAGAVEAAATL